MKNMFESINTEKADLWEKRLRALDGVRDGGGGKMDKNIRETVIALNLNELNASASCEGHLNWGMGAPWVEIAAPNEPKERFLGQKEAVKKIAKKYAMPYKDVMRAKRKDVWREAMIKVSENDETEEYKMWVQKNKLLTEKARRIMEEFYKNRRVEPDIKLELDDFKDKTFRIHNGGKLYKPVVDKMTEEEKQKLKERLPKYQEEIRAFTEFLKEKFFSN